MTAVESIVAGGGAAVLAALRQAAAERNAVDLSQPAPDVTLLVPAVRRAVAAAMTAAAPGAPDPEAALLDALARHAATSLGRAPAAGTEILATASVPAGLAAVAMALLSPGDEAVMIEPAPPERAVLLRRAGVLLRQVAAPAGSALPRAGLAAAVGVRTRMVVLPLPDDPGRPSFGAEDMEWYRQFAGTGTFWTVADGAPAELTWQTPAPPAAAALPGMFERTLSIGVPVAARGLPEVPAGWIAGPAGAIAAVAGARRMLGHGVPASTARALAAALAHEAAADGVWRGLAARRERLSAVLATAGWDIRPLAGGPALIARPPGAAGRDDETAAVRLLDGAGVLAMPQSTHYVAGEPRDMLAFRFDRPAGDIEATATSLKKQGATRAEGGA
ncbi:MAG: hypothetical protein AB7N54_16255 [Alphaproteobacteria bacterium]